MALHYVADLDQLDAAKPTVFTVLGRSIGLVMSGDTLYAVRNVCPHKGAPVCRGTLRGTMLPSDPATFVFGLENKVLQCPWHGWEFNLDTGATLCEPEGRRLTFYPVVVQGAAIYVDIGRRDPAQPSSTA